MWCLVNLAGVSVVCVWLLDNFREVEQDLRVVYSKVAVIVCH